MGQPGPFDHRRLYLSPHVGLDTSLRSLSGEPPSDLGAPRLLGVVVNPPAGPSERKRHAQAQAQTWESGCRP